MSGRDAAKPVALVSDPDTTARDTIAGAFRRDGFALVGRDSHSPAEAVAVVDDKRPNLAVVDLRVAVDPAFRRVTAVRNTATVVRVGRAGADLQIESYAPDHPAVVYVMRNGTPIEDLLHMAHGALRGFSATAGPITQVVRGVFATQAVTLSSFSMIDQRIIELIAKQGAKNAVIGERLGLGPSAVKKHVRGILERLDRTRAELTEWLSTREDVVYPATPRPNS